MAEFWSSFTKCLYADRTCVSPYDGEGGGCVTCRFAPNKPTPRFHDGTTFDILAAGMAESSYIHKLANKSSFTNDYYAIMLGLIADFRSQNPTAKIEDFEAFLKTMDCRV